MCVAAVAWQAHPDWLLVAIGNRDEFHHRPAAPLDRWDNGIVAGRDLEAGGTWLGVSEAGRFGLVTNFRSGGAPRPGAVSRGGLVTGWLAGEPLGDTAAMNPFSLLLADAEGLRFLTNRPKPVDRALTAGLHGLSNGPFDQPWAKTRALEVAIEHWLDSGATDLAPLFDALGNSEPLAGEGPDPPFSSVMIRGPVYGTRCSSVVAVDRRGRGRIAERSFDPAGAITGEVALDFTWPVP